MQTLRELVANAEKQKIAIGHFNISDTEGLWAVFNAARSLEVPVIIGASEGERNFIGVRQTVALVRSLREEFDYPIFLNADHTYSFEKVKEAVDAGFDAVIFDGTELPFDENVKTAKQCVTYAKEKNPDILVEAELGFIGKSSKILDALPEGVKITEEYLTKPEEAAQFVKETGVDLLAPAVGNVHGMLRSGKDPALNIERIRAVYKAAAVPLVLHGGSGTSEDDFKEAIKAGMAIVHINTEIRLAYRKALQIFLQENPDEIAPYKFMKSGVQEMQKVVEARLKLFNGMS